MFTGRLFANHLVLESNPALRWTIWWLSWVAVTAVGWALGAVAAWLIEGGFAALNDGLPTFVFFWNAPVSAAIGAGAFGTVVGATQCLMLGQVLPSFGAKRWILLSALGWTFDPLVRWIGVSPMVGLFQLSALRMGIVIGISWLIATVGARWLLDIALLEAL